MGKLNSYTYPDISLLEAISIAARIVNKFGGQVSRKGLSAELRMAEAGGGFIGKVGALKDYGLAEGRVDIQTTSLAQRIILPASEDEANSARREAFLNVGLFCRLDERISGRSVDDATFAIILSEITGADRIAVRQRATKIRKFFSEVAPLLAGRTAVQANGDSPLSQQRTEDSQRGDHGPGVVELTSGDIRLKLPKNAANIDIMIQALNVMKDELQSVSVTAAESRDEEP